ncbi:MAG TPA: TetR/AcrR family transcriptional regulator [Kineosporiaceae bacterium]|nr:TetR/AcrR family transcriptional regulator [Kineosporiaceae bacterium]
MSEQWLALGQLIPELESRGLVTRTFRRLDPDRQLAVLGAILDEAAARGPASVSIKEVARRGGVSVGALYTYFGNRDGMLAFATELCVRSMTAALDSYGPLLAGMPVREALRAYVVGGVAWGRAVPGLAAFFARGAYQGDAETLDRLVRPIADAMRATIGQILTAAVDRGEVRPDIDLAATTGILHALTIAVGDVQLLPYLNSYLQVLDDAVSTERALEAAIDLVLNGIRTSERP